MAYGYPEKERSKMTEISVPLNQLTGVPFYSFLLADTQREIDYWEQRRKTVGLTPDDENVLNEFNALTVQHMGMINKFIRAAVDPTTIIDEIKKWVAFAVSMLDFIKALGILPDWAKALIVTLESWIKILEKILSDLGIS